MLNTVFVEKDGRWAADTWSHSSRTRHRCSCMITICFKASLSLFFSCLTDATVRRRRRRVRSLSSDAQNFRLSRFYEKRITPKENCSLGELPFWCLLAILHAGRWSPCGFASAFLSRTKFESTAVLLAQTIFSNQITAKTNAPHRWAMVKSIKFRTNSLASSLLICFTRCGDLVQTIHVVLPKFGMQTNAFQFSPVSPGSLTGH